jgi:NADH-quinone oxidoreductase subunit M
VREGIEGLKDLNKREIAAVAPLLALIILLGVFPQIALRAIDPAITQTLTTVGVTDPPPTVAVASVKNVGGTGQ